MTSRTLTVGGSSYPLVLPNIRDPRLHVAAVIITIHVLGQVALHFRVSVPQILAAIVTCAIIEIALTFRSSRSFVWPASAMLTGSGVALILRVVGTPPDDPWNTSSWYVFAGVAGLALLSKYVIRHRGSHVFNPSNIGLVVAFVILGSTRIEPLYFWWAPLDLPMILAYVVIIGGGLAITKRLRLLGLAAAFWVTLASGIGILAASGHCMVANWAFEPVCGFDFWRTIVTSPEVMIFLFFMITDPKTVPAGQVGRIVFGILIGVTSTLLIAPQTDEFGAKVGLLAGLVILCAAHPVLDRFLPEPRSAADDIRRYALGLSRGVARVGLVIATVLVVGVGIVAAGTPARGLVVAAPEDVLGRTPVSVDPNTFPSIAITPDVAGFDQTIVGARAQELVLTLAQNLEYENQGLLHHDASILTAVDHGDRLIEMQGRLDAAVSSGTTIIERYQFDTVRISLLLPFGKQDGLSLGMDSHGTVSEDTYDANGTLVSRRTTPFAQTFVIRRSTGARWLDVAVLPSGAGS